MKSDNHTSMTTRQTPDAVREAVRREIRNAWFDGRLAQKRYDSEAVEAKWDRQVAHILAALDSRAGDAGEGWKLIDTLTDDRRYAGPLNLYDPAYDKSADNFGTSWDGYWNDGDGTDDAQTGGHWVAAVWCNSHDEWHSTRINPTHYREPPAAPSATPAPAGDAGEGFVFWNPDSGEEYAPNHPVDSGECVEAERIRPSTPQEDTLWRAFQEQFARAEALSATPAPAVDAVPAGEVRKMVETLRSEMAAAPKRDWYPVHRDYLDAILSAALSHGEGRK